MKEKPFAEGLHIYKLIWIFVIGSFVGYLYETVLYFFTTGKWVDQQGLLYGPFNQVYGFGAVLFMITLYFFRNGYVIFLLGSLLGGLFEFLASYLQEALFHVISWDYSDHFLNFQGRTSVPVMLFWGLLALVFVKWIAPFLDKGIDRISALPGRIITYIMILFFIFDFSISLLAFNREEERKSGIPPQGEMDVLMDKWYPSSYLEKVFPNKRPKTTT